jgi:hypothetical protein
VAVALGAASMIAWSVGPGGTLGGASVVEAADALADGLDGASPRRADSAGVVSTRSTSVATVATVSSGTA